MDDSQIISALRRRDEAGLQELMRRYAPLLRYVISPILSDDREREECLADIYLKLWDKSGSFDAQRGGLSAWLTVIARNTALNRARSLRRRPEKPMEDDLDSAQESAEEALLRRERQRAILKAVEDLKEADRALFCRKYYYCQSTALIQTDTDLVTMED